MPRVVVAPDKFRGTADGATVSAAMVRAARAAGWDPVPVPLSDGGEGLLEACAGRCPEVVVTTVTGPDGAPVAAEWRVGDRLAVVEMARASGLTLAGGPDGNDPLAATSRGTGELVVAAARRVGPGGTVVLGLGGSATTDGGRGLLEAVAAGGGLGGVELVGACDVDVPFADAATVFAPQKGAGPAQVALLARRLEDLARGWRDRTGVDVRLLAGTGAAGGTGGAVVVLGGRIESGYRLVSDLVGLPDALAGASVVVTGEGALDATTFAGKVVGGVIGDARGAGLGVLVVCGRATADGREGATVAGGDVVSLTERFGPVRAADETAACIEEVTRDWLSGPGRGSGPGPEDG